VTIIYIPDTSRTTPEVGDIFAHKDEAPFFKAGKHGLEPWDDMNVYHAEDVTIFNEDDFDAFADKEIVILEAIDCSLEDYNIAKREYNDTLVDDVHETEVGSLTKNFKIDGWKLQAIVDGDNHLTLAITHIDHSKVHSMDVDIASDDYEYVERYTTTHIEAQEQLDDDGKPEAIRDTYSAWKEYTSSLMSIHNKEVELSDSGVEDYNTNLGYTQLTELNNEQKHELNGCIARLHEDGFAQIIVEKYEPSNTHADRLLDHMVVKAISLKEDDLVKAYKLITGDDDCLLVDYDQRIIELTQGMKTTSPEKLLSYISEVEL
tara:strand:+ start:4075 stop:5028 length:954 start_codon:yes stop_codon:yes gene_type:complete